MKFIFTILIVLTALYTLRAQGSQEWAERYNGLRNSTDIASSIAIDSSDNVYVTGSSVGNGSGYDFTTIKYNPAGDSLWVVRFNGAANENDFAYAIAVDKSGNIYVTGSSVNIALNTEIITIKYNTSGVQQWVASYSGPGSYDYGSSIALDDSGNVFLTGQSRGNGTGNDYVTIKYNSSGDSIWVARYSGPGDFPDYPSDIALDVNGNVYVTGRSFGGGLYYDYATVKYNSSGNEVWVAKYDGPDNADDQANSLAVDGNGNVYVTGVSFNSLTYDDYVTIKYNSSGNSVWVRSYNGPGNSEDAAYSIALDLLGNIYVTGKSYGNGTSGDYATIKYNSSGDSLWLARYNGTGNYNDEPASLVLDAFGNVYVTGFSYGIGTDYDYASVKYNSSGDSLWVGRYNGLGNNNDYAKAIAVNRAGNIYITGSSDGSGTYSDYATVKYSTTTGSQQVTLKLTALVEGLYNVNLNSMISDTMKVYLRNSVSPFNKIDSAISYLNSSGEALFSFENATNGVSFFIELNHRNGLETWSKTAQSFVSDSLNYDFTDNSGKAFGDNMIQKGIKWTVFSGDINHDGFIDLTDILEIFNDATELLTGYVNTDLNGDNIVDLTDVLIAVNNSKEYVGKIIP